MNVTHEPSAPRIPNFLFQNPKNKSATNNHSETPKNQLAPRMPGLAQPGAWRSESRALAVYIRVTSGDDGSVGFPLLRVPPSVLIAEIVHLLRSRKKGASAEAMLPANTLAAITERKAAVAAGNPRRGAA
jgi:hypothetical protein